MKRHRKVNKATVAKQSKPRKAEIQAKPAFSGDRRQNEALQCPERAASRQGIPTHAGDSPNAADAEAQRAQRAAEILDALPEEVVVGAANTLAELVLAMAEDEGEEQGWRR